MRLKPEQIERIRAIVAEQAGGEAAVWLFGSRVDDTAKGGDVDLLVEVPRPVESPAWLAARIAGRVSRALDDRKVDVVLAAPKPQASAHPRRGETRRSAPVIVDRRAADRLARLAVIVERELKHVLATDARLFAEPFTAARAQSLDQDPDLAERVEAFVARFGRLQDTLGDTVLPAWLAVHGERAGAFAENLDLAERLGLIDDAQTWIDIRRLRNQMIHEYVDDPEILASALTAAHDYLPVLGRTAAQLFGKNLNFEKNGS